jgi:hypothetical protein
MVTAFQSTVGSCSAFPPLSHFDRSPGVSHVADFVFVVVIVAVFALLHLVAKGASRL